MVLEGSERSQLALESTGRYLLGPSRRFQKIKEGS